MNEMNTTQEAAKQLNIDHMALQRLFALKLLNFVTIGANERRVLTDDIVRYVRAGSQRLAMPKFGLNIRAEPGRFRTLVIEALQSQLLSDAEVNRRAGTSRKNFEQQLTVNAAVRSLMNSPAPNSEGTPFTRWGDAFAVHVISDAIKRAMGQAPTVAKLYQSPEAFDAYVRKGSEAFKAGRIEFGKTYSLKAEFGPNHLVTVTYFLPHSELLNAVQVAAIVREAF
jgi:hypothetical protein